MNKLKFYGLGLVGIISVLFLSGCSLGNFNSSANLKTYGGVWLSQNSGNNFAQASDLLTTKGKISSFGGLALNRLVFDPQDNKTIYALTQGNGVFYTLDAGASWRQFGSVAKGNIISLAVDHNNKCVVYFIVDNKLFKTNNCGRDISEMYYHQKTKVILTALAVSQISGEVYLGTSDGEILKSVDGGQSWATVMREKNDRIADIVIDFADAKKLYVATLKNGIFKSIDAGASWRSLGDGLKSYIGSHEYRQLALMPATVDGLILVSKFGLLKSTDGGDSWQIIEILPESKKTSILALAINPKDSNEFYYATLNSLVKTVDGGVKWSSKKLPFSVDYQTNGLFVSNDNPAYVYLINQPIKK